MSHRNVQKEDFVGKTITDLECDAVNIIRFTFDDGTRLALEVDAMGHGIYGMVACDECVEEPQPPYSSTFILSTYVPKAELAEALHVWIHTPIIRLHKYAGDGVDLYLRIVSHASGLTYEEVKNRWKSHDDGIIEARRWVKNTLFYRLNADPASILRPHD